MKKEHKASTTNNVIATQKSDKTTDGMELVFKL